MDHYDGTLTLREARKVYFDANHFGDDGGYNDAWVKVKFGPFPVAFPNTTSRVRAVRFHDLHHVMTGYQTTNSGEGEIGAWEVASGCGDNGAAWVLNLTAMAAACLLAPRAVFRSFVRGRHSNNLYDRVFDDALLDRQVADMRRELRLDQPAPRPTAGDIAAFAGWAVAAVVVTIPMGVVTPLLGAGAMLAARFTT